MESLVSLIQLVIPVHGTQITQANAETITLLNSKQKRFAAPAVVETLYPILSGKLTLTTLKPISISQILMKNIESL